MSHLLWKEKIFMQISLFLCSAARNSGNMNYLSPLSTHSLTHSFTHSLTHNTHNNRVMFKSGMKECTTNVVEIKHDVKYEVFLAFLKYLYMDTDMCPPEYAVELLDLATEYNLPRLRKICQRKIQREICIENAA